MVYIITVSDLLSRSILTDNTENQCKNAACIVSLLKDSPSKYGMTQMDDGIEICILCILNDIATYLYNKDRITIHGYNDNELQVPDSVDDDAISLLYIKYFRLSVGDTCNSFSKSDIVKSVLINNSCCYYYISVIELLRYLRISIIDGKYVVTGYEHVMYNISDTRNDHVTNSANNTISIYSQPITIGKVQYLSRTVNSISGDVITTAVLVHDSNIITIVRRLTIIKCKDCVKGMPSDRCKTICRCKEEAIRIYMDISTIVGNSTLPKEIRDNIEKHIKIALEHLHDKQTKTVFDSYINITHHVVKILKTKISPYIDHVPFTTVTHIVGNRYKYLISLVLLVLELDSIDDIPTLPCVGTYPHMCDYIGCECRHRLYQANYLYSQYMYVVDSVRDMQLVNADLIISSIVYVMDTLVLMSLKVHASNTDASCVVIPPHGEITTCMFIDMYNTQNENNQLNIHTILTMFQNKISSRQIVRYNSNTIPVLPIGVISMIGCIFTVMLLGSTTTLYTDKKHVISIDDRMTILRYSRFSIYSIILMIDDIYFSKDRQYGISQTLYTTLMLCICKMCPPSILVMITNNTKVDISDDAYDMYISLLSVCRTLVLTFIRTHIEKSTVSSQSCEDIVAKFNEITSIARNTSKRPIIQRAMPDDLLVTQPISGSSIISHTGSLNARAIERASYKTIPTVLIHMATTYTPTKECYGSIDVLDISILKFSDTSRESILHTNNYKTTGYRTHIILAKLKNTEKVVLRLLNRTCYIYTAPQYFFMPSQRRRYLYNNNYSLCNNALEVCDLCCRVSYTYDVNKNNNRLASVDTTDIVTIDTTHFIKSGEIRGKCTSCQSTTTSVNINGFMIRAFTAFTGNRTRNTPLNSNNNIRKHVLTHNCRIVTNRNNHEYTPYLITMCANCDSAVRVTKANLVGSVYMDGGCIDAYTARYYSINPRYCINPKCNLTKNKKFTSLPTYSSKNGCYWSHVCSICVQKIPTDEWIFRTEEQWIEWVSKYKINLSQIDYDTIK